MSAGIVTCAIEETPVAILDLETTGLNAGTDRVLEVSVARIEPGTEPKLVLDTLVNPRRGVAATEIHGITDADVADAPEFHEIAGNVVNALSDCIVAAYNVYFDMRFLDYELERSGIVHSPPRMCLMYMRPLLGLGRRCSLQDACVAHDIDHPINHVAANDVWASARLMQVYFDVMREREIRTFGELASLRSYKFFDSFRRDPLFAHVCSGLSECRRLKPRRAEAAAPEAAERIPERLEPAEDARTAMKTYWDALKTVICDLEISDAEFRYLKEKEHELGLRPEQVRVLHARAFGSAISQFVDDQWLDDRESRTLKRLHECLSQLGWAPGE